MPYDETLGAYQRLIEKGKIRHAGASNLDAGQLTAALKIASQKSLPRYEVLQPEYNLYDRSSLDGPLLDLCVVEEIGVITYFSLAKGFLSGKYRSDADLGKSPRGSGVGKYLNARGFRILAALDAVSARHSASQAEVALAWVIARPGVTAPIASATTLPQMESLIRVGVAEAQRVRHGRTGCSQRTVGARHYASMPSSLSRLTAVGGKGGGFWDFAASISSSSQAASVSPTSRAMNSALSRPAGIGFRKRALIVPG